MAKSVMSMFLTDECPFCGEIIVMRMESNLEARSVMLRRGGKLPFVLKNDDSNLVLFSGGAQSKCCSQSITAAFQEGYFVGFVGQKHLSDNNQFTRWNPFCYSTERPDDPVEFGYFSCYKLAVPDDIVAGRTMLEVNIRPASPREFNRFDAFFYFLKILDSPLSGRNGSSKVRFKANAKTGNKSPYLSPVELLEGNIQQRLESKALFLI